MIVGIVLGGYAIAWLIAARLAFYAIRSDEEDTATDSRLEPFMLAALAVLTGLMWPLAVPIAIVMWHPRKTPAELREQLEARDRRIAELEREAGIRS